MPEALVEAEVHRHLESEDRLEDDEHRAEVDESARKALHTQFLLDAIAEKEEVTVGQQELIEYLVMTRPQYGMEPDEFAKAVDEAGQIPAMVAEVARRKALAVVLEKATVVDADGNEVDLNELFNGEDERRGAGHEGHDRRGSTTPSGDVGHECRDARGLRPDGPPTGRGADFEPDDARPERAVRRHRTAHRAGRRRGVRTATVRGGRGRAPRRTRPEGSNGAVAGVRVDTNGSRAPDRIRSRSRWRHA